MKIVHMVLAVVGAAAVWAGTPSAAWAAAPPTPQDPGLSKGTYEEANPPCYGQTPPSINATSYSPEVHARAGARTPALMLKGTLEIERPGEGPFLRRTEVTWPSNLWVFSVPKEHFSPGTYQFRIRSENDQGVSPWTPWCTFTFDGPGLAATAYSPDGGDHCLDVAAAGTADGTKVQLWDCNGTPAQAWRLNGPKGDLINVNSGKCLDVTAAGTGDGTKVQLYNCNRTGAQEWRHGQPHANAFRNPHSDKCLDVSGANFTNGTHLQIHTCHDRPAQIWEPVPLS